MKKLKIGDCMVAEVTKTSLSGQRARSPYGQHDRAPEPKEKKA